jgi:signal transduction histidine kinase
MPSQPGPDESILGGSKVVVGALQIPGIEIGPELGHGAHSVVYRATKGTRPCAVKVPRGTSRSTRWAYRDAVALARVRHPGLPRVLDVGEVGDVPYLVLELVLGETLADRLRRSALNELETLRIIAELADALAAIHDAGLVHRDVHPHNIVFDPSGPARLIDLGFGAAVEGSREKHSAGTHAYAAPEQIHDTATVDGRADLYATGRVLVECLTGRPPSNGGIPPDGISSEVRCALPFGDVIAGLLADDPDERYPDARALLSELDRVREGRQPRGPAAYHATRRSLPTLVGRQAELARLLRGWGDVGSSGQGSVAVVEGLRGGGKTSLLAAFAQGAAESGSGRVISISCRYADPPLALLRRMLEAYMAGMGKTSRADRAADEAALRASASGYLTGFATLIAPKLTALLGDAASSVEPAPGGFPEGVAELIARLARAAGPLLLLVDDTQWIDPISLQVLLRVEEKALNAPLMLVLSTRPTGTGGALAPELDPRRTARIELSPLDERQVAELVAAHLGEVEPRPDLARRVASLADGTPLGVFEVLGAMLDLGALRPSDGGWTVDVERMSRMVLPQGSLALLGRRLSELSAATRQILETAAVLGTEFEDEVLVGIAGVAGEELRQALAEARRAGLVEVGERGSHRFVHDSAREMLTGALSEGQRRKLHDRVAMFLEAGAANAETLYAVATHYAAGSLGTTAPRAYVAARKAADSAIARFDNETALRFLDLARRAADIGGTALDTGFFRSVGEANLRLGALEESLRAFESALEKEGEQKALAAIHGRIAWVEQARGDSGRAWAALSRAFASMGVVMPSEDATTVALTLRDVVASEWKKRRLGNRMLDGAARVQTEILCDLHVQNARLGYEYGKPLRATESAIAGMRLGKLLGKSRAQARSLTVYGFVLTSLGFHRAGARTLASAERMASELHDPVIVTRCMQTRAVSAAFAGRIELALTLMRECVDAQAPWLEANEYSLDAATGELIESLRGRCDEAWAWITRAIERQRRSYRTTVVFDQILVHRARACLVSLGRTAEPGSWLAHELERTRDAVPPSGDFHRGVYFGARARASLDSGEVGPAFDELVTAFEAEGHDPKRVHLNASEYYVAVAHARVHQFLRASRDKRSERLRAVEVARRDLVAAAKLPILRAHALFVEGFVATFRGEGQKAVRLLGQAENLAGEENAPWVSYAVARTRAHHLRDEGKLEAALDQARIAEVLAREHGAEPRARWVREEFGLPNTATIDLAATREGERGRMERRLHAMLRPLRSPELRPEQQAAAILTDLLRELDADRGFILFQPDRASGWRLRVGKNRQGDESSEIDPSRERWLDTIRESGEPWPPLASSTPVVAFHRTIDPLRVLAAPLLLGEAAVGAASLERSAGAPPFSADDRELFLLVSRQMPIALEMAQLFVERDQLHATLRQAQKMEAVGQLAGGIAHDFTNMLTLVQGTLVGVRRKLDSKGDVEADLEMIADAVQRAGRLMRQLLGFSRHQAATPRVCVVNDVIAELLPMLQKLAGDRVKVALRVDPDLDDVRLVRASFDQALVNLVVNARDAMEGGSITIATKQVALDETALSKGALNVGPHVAVEVSDTGHGIAPEHLHQVFDPFFTTKTAGNGTGLGLMTVYAFVRNSGGHVEIASVVGKGTTISLFFPVAHANAADAAVGQLDDRRYASLS